MARALGFDELEPRMVAAADMALAAGPALDTAAVNAADSTPALATEQVGSAESAPGDNSITPPEPMAPVTDPQGAALQAALLFTAPLVNGNAASAADATSNLEVVAPRNPTPPAPLATLNANFNLEQESTRDVVDQIVNVDDPRSLLPLLRTRR